MGKTKLSEPAQHVLELAKLDEDGELRFYYVGDEEQAKKYIHRMRVELSRMRNEIRKGNKIPVRFKMIVVKVELKEAPEFFGKGVNKVQVPGTGKTLVVLKKTMPGGNAIKEINAIFDETMVAGEKLHKRG